MKIPDRHEIILLLIGFNKEPFRGKTNLHKNIYLAKEMAPGLELPFDFKAHFYGPFSQQVSEEIDILQNCGLIKTSQMDLGVKDIFEVKQYSYELTKAGTVAFENLTDKYKDFCAQFAELFETIRNTGFHQNTKILATAAKVRLILTSEARSMNKKNIISKAKELGWDIKDTEINQALRVLQATALVKVVNAE